MHPRSRSGSLVRALLTITAAAAVIGTATGAAATTPTTTSPAKAAGGWLARQLVGAHHDHYAVSAGRTSYPDAGMTVDGLLSMDAAGDAQAAAARMTRWLQANAKSYATGSGYTPGHYYPGSLAKLLLAAEAEHARIHAFGGIDLVRAIKREEQPNGAYANTADKSFGSSPVAQSLALIALSHTGSLYSWPNANAIAWLVGQQCRDGGFVSYAQQTPATSCHDVDSTAYAAQALLTVHSSAAARAVQWLRVHRNRDGGYGLDPSTGKASSNANSSALAAQALLHAGYTAASALHWLRTHQIGCSGPVSRRGAVPYSGRYVAATALRATTQAGQALARKWLGDITDSRATADAPVLRCS